MNEKRNVIFFARDYQTILFPKLNSSKYNSIFVTLLKTEKLFLNRMGIQVAGCFEEEYEALESNNFPDSYLITSFVTDRFLGGFNILERRKILSKEISFWTRILDFYKPIAVLNEVIAIEIAEVMYIEAKKRNVKYWAWMVSPFEQKCFYWLSIPYHSQLDDSVFNSNINEREFAIEYISKFQNNSNVKPFYAINLDSRLKIPNLFKGILVIIIVFIKKMFSKKNLYFHSFYYDSSIAKQKVSCFFNSLFFKYSKLQKDLEIIFYPLHFEPEASILYMSEFNEEQAALIRNICKCLKNNQILVVKEHPQQAGMLLSKKYRKLAHELSNLMVLPAEYSTNELLKKSKLIITQTSTAGWEGLLIGKPVIVLGKVFYDKHPDVNKFVDFNSLKEIIHSELYKTPSYENNVAFVQKIWNYCELGNPYQTKSLYYQENLNNIVTSIERKLFN